MKTLTSMIEHKKKQKEFFFETALSEVSNAQEKFPDPSGNMAALMEEVGELAKAMLEEPQENVWIEAFQVAAMACRIACEGDPTLDSVRAINLEKSRRWNVSNACDDRHKDY